MMMKFLYRDSIQLQSRQEVRFVGAMTVVEDQRQATVLAGKQRLVGCSSPRETTTTRSSRCCN